MSTEYDAIVLGAGPSGEVCAAALSDGGVRVAVVERELVAGECSYWACIPSKTLLRPGEAVHGACEAPGAHEAVTGELDAAAALAWRDFMVSGYDDGDQVKWLEDKGVDLLRGAARITAPGTVEAGGRTLTAREIVVATGSEPTFPPIPGLRELEGVWTNREATGLKAVPRRLIILGGGPVGVELAQAIRRLGAEVVVVENGPHVLSREPAAAGEALGRALERDGVEIRCGANTVAARRDGEAYVLDLEGGEEVRGDRLLVATGRRPRTDGLGVEAAGVRLGERGEVTVDAHLRAGDGLWAIGDVTGIWPLTYVGKYQARIAAANILGAAREANYDAVPRVVFTDPQVASIGERDGSHTSTVRLADVSRMATYTRAYAEREDFVSLVSDGERLTGAYALGPDAGEWLQQATLAIRARIPLAVLRDTIQPFPTFSEVFVSALAQLDATVPTEA